MLADLRWLGLDWDEGPDKGGEVNELHRMHLSTPLAVSVMATLKWTRLLCATPENAFSSMYAATTRAVFATRITPKACSCTAAGYKENPQLSSVVFPNVRV